MRKLILHMLLGVSFMGASTQAIGASTQALGGEEIIEEVVVTGASSIHDRLGNMGSASVLSGDEIAAIGATHVNEVLARVPGVWISRGSGQEHLAAIRSPVYTGAGACGEFSYLENGIPIRPAGFCNVNNLFEVNTEQAQAIEVWRGPASAVLGGNALHGAINVITPEPTGFALSVEGGPYDFARLQVSGGIEIANHQLGASLISVSSAGYRDDTGYDQQKFLLSHQTQWRDWQISNTLSASLLNQETGGFVLGFEAYDDSTLRTSNPNPEAFRDAWSLRLSSEISKDEWTIKPYLRRSKMAFLQHFLPGQPLEENAQSSGGVIVNYAFERGNAQVDLGAQLEYMQGELRQFQSGPTVGSAFLVATRPAGLHYDYDVDSLMAAVFYNLSIDLRDDVRLIHSLRIEHLAYDYENHHLVGNTRDDGTPCGFGGCLYTRPPSGDTEFTNVAVRVGVEKDFGDYLLYSTVSTGFRPPQATELYRLRGGQVLADLDSEELVGVEVGLKNSYGSISLFSEKTRNLILRDSEAFNVSDGKTVSVGVELEAHWSRGAHTLSLATTWARHEYDFNRMATGREIIEDGNQIDTAPRWLTNARWQMDVSENLRHELELNIVGEHYVNAANTAKYDGHQVLNWRGDWQASRNLNVYARIINLLDERYADRADFAFGNYRYFPAMPRQLYVGVRYQLQ